MPNTEPFTPIEVAACGSLAVALDRLVFSHPTVVELRKGAQAAMAAARMPFYDNAGLISPVYGHDEEMLPLKWFADRDDPEAPSRDEIEKIMEGTVWALPRLPAEYRAFCDEVVRRCSTLIEMLTQRRVEGICYTARSKEREPLLHTIWKREEFYILPHTGDLFEARPEKMVLRWTSVALQLPGAEVAIHAQPITSIVPKAGVIMAPLLDMSELPKSLQSIHVAVMALWEGKIPDLLRAGQRDKQIFDYLKAHPDLSMASSSSIKRYMREYKKAAAARRRVPREHS